MNYNDRKISAGPAAVRRTFRRMWVACCVWAALLCASVQTAHGVQVVSQETLPVRLEMQADDSDTGNSVFYKGSLSGSFKFPSDTAAEPLYLLVSPTIYACRIYVNGALLASRGYDHGTLNTRTGSFDYYLIPDRLLNAPGEQNRVVMEVTTTRGYQSAFPSLTLATGAQAAHKAFALNYFNVDLPRILNVVGILIALFFLFVYYSKQNRKERRMYLLFVFMSLSLAVCCAEAAFGPVVSDSFALERLSMTGIFIFGLAQVLFVDNYYDLTNGCRHRRWILWGVAALFAGVLLPVLLIRQPHAALSYYHTAIDLFFTPWMLAVVLVYSYKAWHAPIIQNIVLCLAYWVSLLVAGINIFLYKNNPDINPLWIAYTIQLLLFLYFFMLEFRGLVRLLRSKSQALQQQNRIMESLVEMRTKELAESNAKLAESVEELRTANNLKDKFFSIMAHDIKNPLNAIMGFSQLLEEGYAGYDEKQRMEIICQINSDSENLYKILDNLLEWSRCQVGRMAFSPVELSAGDMLDNILPIERSKAKIKEIDIVAHADRNLKVFADPNMLSSILRNLIGNAVKFSYKGGTVEIEMLPSDSGIRIVVSDHGVGMSQEQMNNLFRIDLVASTAGTGGESGTGLGLIVCKEFVDYHKGRLEVESLKGQGSKFLIWLPYKTGNQSSAI